MRRGRLLIIVGLLLIIVVAGGYLVYTRVLQPAPGTPSNGGVETAPTPQTQMTTAVRLTQPVNRGAVIDETVLDTVQIPDESFLPGMFSELGEAVGRKAKYDLEAGMLLSSQVLLDTNEVLPLSGSDWSLVIEPGKVAVSVPISRLSSVSYAPQAGDSVDVIATLMLVDLDTDFQTTTPDTVSGVVSPGTGFVSGTSTGQEAGASITETTTQILTAQVGAGEQGRVEVDPALGVPLYLTPSEDTQRPRMVSQSVIRNVRVLRVGDFPFVNDQGELVSTSQAVPTPVPVEGQQTQQEVQQPEIRLPDVITLIVNPQDAITLNYLLYSGAQLNLALRASGDTSTPPTEAVTLQFLLDQYNIPVPARLPYGVEPRVDKLVPPALPNDAEPTPLP